MPQQHPIVHLALQNIEEDEVGSLRLTAGSERVLSEALDGSTDDGSGAAAMEQLFKTAYLLEERAGQRQVAKQLIGVLRRFAGKVLAAKQGRRVAALSPRILERLGLDRGRRSTSKPNEEPESSVKAWTIRSS